MPRPKLDRTSLTPASRRLNDIPEHVVPLRKSHEVAGGISFERLPSGKLLSLTITMPYDGEYSKKPLHAADEWLMVENLAVPFAEALFIAMAGNSSRTFYTAFYQIKPFFQFLIDNDYYSYRINEISTSLVAQYIIYLSARYKSKVSRRQCYSILRNIIYSLESTPAYAELVSAKLVFPKNPWEGGTAEARSNSAIPLTELIKIEKACLKEIRETLEQIERGRLLVRESTNFSPASWGNSASLAQILAFIESNLNGHLPSLRAAADIHPALAQGVRDAGGLIVIWRHLHLTARSAMPFIVLLCIRTAFNAESTVAIRKDCVRKNPILICDLEINGTDSRYRVISKKRRAKYSLRRSYPASDKSLDNPIILTQIVLNLTKTIRPFVVREHADRLFVFPSTQFEEVRGFNLKGGSTYNAYLDHFIEDNDLMSFRLSHIRPTMDGLIDILTEGDVVAKREVLGHRHSDTTDDHYTSDASKAKRRERLAEHLNQRDRWVATSGRSDPRRSDMGGTKRAATGGFECMDPYDSPIPGEKPGRLCEAWGSCPTCPLAGVNVKDPFDLARIIQLETSVSSARLSVSRARWLDHWLPQLRAIENIWLPMFSSKQVWAKAEAFRLPPLDVIE